MVQVAYQPHSLARDGQPHFDLRTDGHPLDELAQDIDQKAVQFVAAVIAHPLVEEASTNAQTDDRV
jgi:hypothetical protein